MSDLSPSHWDKESAKRAVDAVLEIVRTTLTEAHDMEVAQRAVVADRIGIRRKLGWPISRLELVCTLFEQSRDSEDFEERSRAIEHADDLAKAVREFYETWREVWDG